MLRSIAGLGFDSLRHAPSLPDGASLRFAAMLAQRPRTALGLERVLTSYFGVAVRVRQFIGRWRTLEPEDSTRLGKSCNELGSSAVLGERVWDQAGRVRLVIGPLSLPQFMDYLPNGTAMAPLRELARLYLGSEMEIECRLVLRAGEVPPAVLDPAFQPRLGLTSWLGTSGARMQHAQVTLAGGSV